MKRRGVSQLDWIMSLAIFLLYVIWFFIFIGPSVNFTANKNNYITILNDKFIGENNWQIARFPLFLEFNSTGSYKPVIINYNRNISELKFSGGNDFILWDNKLIFLPNITSNIETFWILQKNYTKEEYGYSGVSSSLDYASTENLTVQFSSGLPASANYKGGSKIKDAEYSINGISFSPEIQDYTDSGFAAIYTAGTGNINLTTMVFSYNPEIYGFLTTVSQDTDMDFSAEFDLFDYTNYYSDNSLFGSFSYENASKSLNYTYNYVTFYSGTGSLSMYFDSPVRFNFIYYNSTLKAGFTISFNSSYVYRLVFSDKNDSAAIDYSYDARFGLVEVLKGINLNNISANYTFLKNKWGFSNSRDFNIRIYTASSAFIYQEDFPELEIGVAPPQDRQVFSKTENTFALDDDGSYTPIAINYRIW